MKIPFEANAVNSMVLSQRLVRSAAWEGLRDKDGRPFEKLKRCYQIWPAAAWG